MDNSYIIPVFPEQCDYCSKKEECSDDYKNYNSFLKKTKSINGIKFWCENFILNELLYQEKNSPEGVQAASDC